MNSWTLNQADQISLWGVNVQLQATVVTTVALIVGCALRRSAALRHGVLLAGLVLMLLTPLTAGLIQWSGRSGLTFSVGQVAVQPVSDEAIATGPTTAGPVAASPPPRPASPEKLDDREPIAVGPIVVAEGHHSGPPAVAGERPLFQDEKRTALPGSTGSPLNPHVNTTWFRAMLRTAVFPLLMIWLAGSAILLAKLAKSCTCLARILGAARPETDPAIEGSFTRACQKLELEKLPELVVSDRVSGPLSAGLIHPRVVLPERIVGRATPDQLHAILVHEVAHVARRDQVIVLLQNIAAALFWLHPMMKVLNRQLAQAREELCDNYVLRATDAASYSRTLLFLAQLVQSGSAWPGAVGLFTSRWKLESRVAGLLDLRRRRNTHLTRRGWAFVSVTAVALAVVTAFGTISLAVDGKDTDAAPKATAENRAATGTDASGKAPNNSKDAGTPPSLDVSRAWYILRQPNSHDFFHGLPQRVDKFLTSPRTGAVWEGVPDGGSLSVRIDVEGDAAGEIVVAFFSDPRWWLAPPVQLRSFPGPGEYVVERLPLRKLQLGALVGGLPRPKAYGVHQTWPAPVEVKASGTEKTRVFVSSKFTWMTQVHNTRDFTGDWPRMDARRLITVRAIDEQGNPEPFCRVTLARRDRKNTFEFHNLGTDERGYAYSDAVDGTFSIRAARNDFVPETLSTRWQSKKIEQLHDASDHPVITVRWDRFPTGTATLTGRVSNQRGEPLREFYLDISSYRGEQRDWSDASGFGMRIPVIDANGRFEVKNLAAGNYAITAHAFDYYTHAYQRHDQQKFFIPEQPNAKVTADVQLEAREMRYGQAVYIDGRPVHPGSWSAHFQANDSMSLRTNADGTFRVGLTERERELLNKNSDGLVEVFGSGTPPVSRTVRADYLSLDQAKPRKVVLPRPSQPTDTPPSDNAAASPVTGLAKDDSRAVEALKRIALNVKTAPNGTVSEVNFLQRNVTDDDLIHLKGTPNVTQLDLQRSKITDAGLVNVRGLSHLEALNLRGVPVTDAGLENLKDLIHLRSLDIACRGITDAGMRHLERLTNLKELHIESAKITDSGLTSLRGLTRLETLILPGTITDEGLKSLSGMAELRSLSLNGCRLTEAGMVELARFSKLENLSLGGVPVTDEWIGHLATLTRLKDLNLLGSALTDRGLKALSPLTELRSLAVSPAITDDGLVVLKDFPKLEAVAFYCPNITDAGMVHLAELKQLTNIVLPDSQVTDEGVARLAILKKLIFLDLSRTRVTAKGLDHLRSSLPRLQQLQGP